MNRTLRALSFAMKGTRFSAAVLVFVGSLVLHGQAVAQVVRYVDNIDGCKGGLPCYSNIMDAVTAAAPYDIVQIFPGVYDESVSIGSGKDNLVLGAYAKAQPPVITSFVSILGSPNVQVHDLIVEGGISLVGNSSGAVINGNLIRGGGISVHFTSEGTLRNNTVLGGGIFLGSETFNFLIEGNTLSDASIGLGGDDQDNNIIRRNVIRGGGIRVSLRVLRFTTIEGNFVSGSPGDGIFVLARFGSDNVIRRNISIENAGCDLNDQSDSTIKNTWRNNEYGTKCGAATR